MRYFVQSILVAILAIPALPALAQTEMGRTPESPTITVQGVGESYAAPDMATITSGVVTQAETARAALDSNNEAANELMDLMSELGIAGRDIQTSNFNVQPRYQQRRESEIEPRDPETPRGPDIVGYEVSNAITVRVRDLDMLGQILDEAVSVGANRIENVSFSVDDTSTVDDEARRAAVEDARHKAELYAEAAGVELGSIVEITEADYGRPMAESMAVARMSADSAVPVATGELTFTSRVSIVWELVDNEPE